MVKVLYITGTGPFGGASRSLFETIRAMPAGTVESYFVAARGTALNVYRQVAKDVVGTWGISRFDHTQIGFYQGRRWIVLLRELVRWPFTIVALLRARRRWRDIDLIHVNDYLEIGPALFARMLFRVPLVVHVRTLMITDRRMWRTRVFQRILRLADAVVAIDENVRQTLPSDLEVEVIHNGFDPHSKSEPDPVYLRGLERLRPSSLKVGYIGNLLRFKGPGDLLEAAALLKQGGEDVQFLVVGGSISAKTGLAGWILGRLGLLHDMRAELESEVARKGLSGDFLLLGATSDIQRVIPAMDVLAFTTHLNAPGRPVIEAAFFEVPSIVSVEEPRPDTLVPGETGLSIPTSDPALIAEAIRHFARNPDDVKRMGRNARELAERNFRPEVNSRKLLEVYRRLAPGAVGAPAKPRTIPA